MKRHAALLETGNYVIPAYAGMILAEQGMTVDKLVNGRDPLFICHYGKELWEWINHGKNLRDADAREMFLQKENPGYAAVIDNFTPSTLRKWGVKPQEIAERWGVPWVSMRADVGEKSFDIVAQARAWMEYSPHVPFWIGDTAGGLWVAFKLLSCLALGKVGHFPLFQATCLQKLVEGELVCDKPRSPNFIPWMATEYQAIPGDDGRPASVAVGYKGQRVTAEVWTRKEKWANLHHVNGRMKV